MVQVTLSDTARIDMVARYALSADVPVIVRASDEIQIGIEEPRRVLLLDAPPEAHGILTALDGTRPVGAVLTGYDADPIVWSALLGQLVRAGLLVRVTPTALGAGAGPGSLAQERIGLAHRHGHAAAIRILQSRADALVVVRGDSAAAALVATLVAAAGVGHVHHDPTRSGLVTGPEGGRPSGAPATGAVRASNPLVRTYRPAAHQSPTLVVLAGDPVPDLGLAATLVQQRIPHLSVLTLAGGASVGPLVLPGRSSCLGCVHRHRADADPGWPAVARQLARSSPRAPVSVSAVAAGFAAGQVLELLDEVSLPATVNGSMEWAPQTLTVRRRSWAEHPDCGCHAS